MKLTSALAAAGAVIGAVLGVVLHALVFRPRGSVGWWSFARAPRYADYLQTGGGRQALALRLQTSGGWHPSWWPLLPVTVIVGLIVGAILGALAVGYRAWRAGSAS